MLDLIACTPMLCVPAVQTRNFTSGCALIQ